MATKILRRNVNLISPMFLLILFARSAITSGDNAGRCVMRGESLTNQGIRKWKMIIFIKKYVGYCGDGLNPSRPELCLPCIYDGAPKEVANTSLLFEICPHFR